MLKRIIKLHEKIEDVFLEKYFDGVFPKDKYDIELITSGPPIIKIKNKNDKYGWMMYSNYYYLHYYNELRLTEFKKHIASFRIQQWWKKKYYDPKFHIIHNVMNRKYDEYNEEYKHYKFINK